MNVSLSIVTDFSSIASKKALCVFGLALFNSSAKTTFVKIGPFLISNLSFIKKLKPKISLGNKSDVNCILLKSKLRAAVIDFANVVFPVPGKSSIRICPPDNIAAKEILIFFSLPTIFILN